MRLDPAFEADARVRQAGEHAVEMLGTASYLTGLLTLISPPEMIEDPLFHETSGLPTVDNNIVAPRTHARARGPG